jgi:hypothetical protein
MNLRLYGRALSLSYFTVGYNILEGVVSIFAGILAGSIALALACTFLSTALLIGLGLNYLYGIWWADLLA